MRIVTLPGVFRPHSDTWMIADVLQEDEAIPGATVLDVCTGSGAIAVAAARLGAAEVTAVDISRRAIVTTRLNAALNRVRVRARRGDLFAPVRGARFDVIVSNPPYVPADSDRIPDRGPARAWDAGRDGRALLDRLAADAPAMLRPGGRLLVAQSSVADPDRTRALLDAAGLDTHVIRRRRGPLGPILSARARALEARGMLAPGSREEELMVISGRAAA